MKVFDIDGLRFAVETLPDFERAHGRTAVRGGLAPHVDDPDDAIGYADVPNLVPSAMIEFEECVAAARDVPHRCWRATATIIDPAHGDGDDRDLAEHIRMNLGDRCVEAHVIARANGIATIEVVATTLAERARRMTQRDSGRASGRQ